MSRYDAVCELLAETTTKDSKGVVSTSTTARRVFCNVFSMSDAAFYTAVAAGVRPSARLQIRKVDYREERKVVYEGTTYFVDRVERSSTDFVVLTLTERVGDR